MAIERKSKRGSCIRMAEQDERTSAINSLKEGKFLLEYVASQGGRNAEQYELAAKDIGTIIDDLMRRK